MPAAPHCDSPTPCPAPAPETISGSRPEKLTRDDFAPSERTKPPASAPESVLLPAAPLSTTAVARPEGLTPTMFRLLSAPTRTP